MKKFILSGIAIAFSLVAGPVMQAADFFSTDTPENLFTIGVRLGVNTTNRTISDKSFPDAYHCESWGTGFDLGAVVDINFREWFSIQPGLFFESRNGRYVLMGTGYGSGMDVDGSEVGQAGKRRSYNFTIPVMMVAGFNVTDDIRWTVEAGPYVSILMGSKVRNKWVIVDGSADAQPLFHTKPASADFGIKMGTGIRLLGHYYVGAHYLAGCVDAWKETGVGNLRKNYGGVTKAWVFTLGYDF